MSNTPQIRFAGFTDAWEQRKLENITSLITKGTTPKDKSGNGEVNFIKVENIDPSSGIISSCSRISLEEHEGYLKRSQLKENDILFSIAGTLGRTSVVNKGILPANTNQALAILRVSEGDISYLVTVLSGRAVSDFIKKNPTVGAQPNLSLEQVSNLEIPYPSIEEQQKIGDYFRNLDDLITLHQRKCDALQKFKKSMLQKMFPQNGESVPEIRFAGFTDAWEQRELRTAATFSKGSGYSKNDLKENGTPIILYGRLYTKYETVISEVDTFVDVQPNSVYSTGHEVIVPASGETAEDISRASFVAKSGILLGGDLNIIVPDDYINPVFLALTISNGNQQKELSKRAQGKSVVHIHNSDLENVVLLYPKYEEQEKIGEYFSKLDSLITLHQRKLETLQKMKKSLLQKMFV